MKQKGSTVESVSGVYYLKWKFLWKKCTRYQICVSLFSTTFVKTLCGCDNFRKVHSSTLAWEFKKIHLVLKKLQIVLTAYGISKNVCGEEEAYFSTLKMEAICSSETSVDTQRTTRCYIPEDGSLHTHRCENLKSCFVGSQFFFWRILAIVRRRFKTRTKSWVAMGKTPPESVPLFARRTKCNLTSNFGPSSETPHTFCP
jgi:hypothetical protein